MPDNEKDVMSLLTREQFSSCLTYVGEYRGRLIAHNDELQRQLTSAVEAKERAERERDEAESLLASATDLLNTCARENYAVQADRPTGIKFVINNIWGALSGFRAERDTARAESQRMKYLVDDRESFIANYQHATELERAEHAAEAQQLRNELIANKAALSAMEARWLENLALKAPERAEALKTIADLQVRCAFRRDDAI